MNERQNSTIVPAIEQTIARRQAAKQVVKFCDNELATIGITVKEVDGYALWSPNPDDLKYVTSIDDLGAAGKAQSRIVQCCPGWPAAALPEYVRGLPQVGQLHPSVHGSTNDL
jgi:hypothetical protein